MPWLAKKASVRRSNATAVGPLVGEHFGVGEPTVVVDREVDELPTGSRTACPLRCVLAWPRPVAAHAVARLEDPAELLDVDVNQLARVASLVAVRWLWRLEPRELA